MAHLVGIDKGPVMDWTNDAGLDECYRKWKKWLEVLFKGLLSELTDAVKCNYVIYWSGDHGMDLECEPYYIHSIEEIIGKFHGMTKFIIADFNKGYWMVELDPELRKYTTMALDIGKFQWTRLPMGSIVAQDVFQRKLDAIFLSFQESQA